MPAKPTIPRQAPPVLWVLMFADGTGQTCRSRQSARNIANHAREVGDVWVGGPYRYELTSRAARQATRGAK